MFCIGFLQGMNEVLAVLLHVFGGDSDIKCIENYTVIYICRPWCRPPMATTCWTWCLLLLFAANIWNEGACLTISVANPIIFALGSVYNNDGSHWMRSRRGHQSIAHTIRSAIARGSAIASISSYSSLWKPYNKSHILLLGARTDPLLHSLDQNAVLPRIRSRRCPHTVGLFICS